MNLFRAFRCITGLWPSSFLVPEKSARQNLSGLTKPTHTACLSNIVLVLILVVLATAATVMVLMFGLADLLRVTKTLGLSV